MVISTSATRNLGITPLLFVNYWIEYIKSSNNDAVSNDRSTTMTGMFLNSSKNKQGSMLRRETQLPRNPLNKTTWFNPQHDNAMRDFGVKHVTLPLVLVEIDRKLGYVTRKNPTKREYSSSGHAHDAPNMLLNHRLYN